MVAQPPLRRRPSAAPLREALRALVEETGGQLGPDLWSGDLRAAQTVGHYSASADAMRRYTHMYAGKHAAAWATLRARLGWGDLRDRPLVSLGAGPMLCLAGWLHDHGPHPDARAIDPLDWSPVLSSPAGVALQRALGGPRREEGVYAPMFQSRPPGQLSHLCGLRALQPADIPAGSTVLMPMMLNHLLEGGDIPCRTAALLRLLFLRLRSSGCRVVVADLADRKSTALWSRLSDLLGAGARPNTLTFTSRLAQQRDLYAARHAGYRTSGRMARLSVLAWNGKRWQEVEG